MQTVLTYLSFLCAGFLLQAQNNTITVSIDDIKNNEGVVLIGLYDDPANFLNKLMVGKAETIEDGRVIATFENVPDGVYAVSAFHDENEDGEFNMLLGIIPNESYGTSNGAKGFFGPPKWEDAKFEVKNNEIKKINIDF